MSSNLTWLIDGNYRQSGVAFIFRSHDIPYLLHRSFHFTQVVDRCIFSLELPSFLLRRLNI